MAPPSRGRNVGRRRQAEPAVLGLRAQVQAAAAGLARSPQPSTASHGWSAEKGIRPSLPFILILKATLAFSPCTH